MSAPTTSRKSKGKGKAKKSVLQLDIGSLGKKGALDEDVEHPPFVPTLPTVNLLPESVRDSILLGKVIKGLVAVAVVMLLGAAALWYLQGARISDSEAALQAAQVENTKLSQQVQAMSPVTAFYEQLTGQQGLVTTTMAAQPEAAMIFDKLSADAAAVTGKPGVVVSGIHLSFTGVPAPGTPANSCVSPDPFGSEITVGCATFNATASTREQVAELLRVLEADPLFVGPYVDNTSFGITAETGDPSLAFTGSVGISPDGLATPLTPEQITALMAPAVPSPSPAPAG